MKILISGSRFASKEMLQFTENVVTSYIERGHDILFGDAIGIDMQVHNIIAKNNKQGRKVGRCYHVQSTGLRFKQEYPRHVYYVNVGDMKFWQRDRLMVDRADFVLCIWNGKSKGTKAVYDYAGQLGKARHLQVFA